MKGREDMRTLLLLLGLVGVPVFLVLIVSRLLRKRSVGPMLLGLIVSAAVLVTGVILNNRAAAPAISPAPTTVEESAPVEEPAEPEPAPEPESGEEEATEPIEDIASAEEPENVPPVEDETPAETEEPAPNESSEAEAQPDKSEEEQPPKAEPQSDEPTEESPTETDPPALTLTPTETEEPAGDRNTPEAEESEESQARDYVLNTNTGKFHYPDCGSVKKMAEKNRQDVHDTREHILAMGYEPCKNCNP